MIHPTFCTLRKVLQVLIVLTVFTFISLIISCSNKPVLPSYGDVYRDAMPDSIMLKEADLNHIAEMVQYKQYKIEYERSQNNTLLKIAATLITLLLGGLMWFLRQMLTTIPKLQTEVNKLSLTISASEQWNKDQRDRCVERHAELNEQLKIKK